MTRIVGLLSHQLKTSQLLCFLSEIHPSFDNVSCLFKLFKRFDDFSMKKSYFDWYFLHVNYIFLSSLYYCLTFYL